MLLVRLYLTLYPLYSKVAEVEEKTSSCKDGVRHSQQWLSSWSKQETVLWQEYGRTIREWMACFLDSFAKLPTAFGCCGFHLTNLWISGYRSFVNTYASVMTPGHIEVNSYIFLRRICCFLSRDFSSQQAILSVPFSSYYTFLAASIGYEIFIIFVCSCSLRSP
jgi:hypothetical protein